MRRSFRRVAGVRAVSRRDGRGGTLLVDVVASHRDGSGRPASDRCLTRRGDGSSSGLRRKRRHGKGRAQRGYGWERDRLFGVGFGVRFAIDVVKVIRKRR